VLVRRVDERHAGLVEHAEVADERLEPRAEPRRGDHRVDLDEAVVGEHGFALLEAVQRRDHRHRSFLDRLDEADVDDRDHAAPKELGVRAVRRRQPHLREIAERRSPQPRRDRVDHADGQACTRDPEELARHAESVAPDQAGRCLHREQDLARAGARDVDRDLGAGVAGADDQHPPAAVGLAVPVRRRVDELAGERPGPLREVRHVAVARRHDDARRADALSGDAYRPFVTVPVDPRDGRARADVEVVPGRVGAQVVDHGVSRGPLPGRARDAVPGQPREPTHRMEMEAVVARRPGGADLETLQHRDVGAGPSQRHRARETGRPGADHADPGGRGRAHGRCASSITER
jgi:hypothetical protein